MTGLTKINAAPVPVDPKAFIDGRSGKPRRVSRKVRKAIDLLATGECKTTKAAAERAGVSANFLYKAFAMPHVRAEIDARTRGELDHAKPIAAARLVELVNSESHHVSFDSARHVLSIANIRPPDAPPAAVTVNAAVNVGWIIDLGPAGESEDTPRKVIDVTPATPMRADEIDREGANIVQAHLVKPVGNQS